MSGTKTMKSSHRAFAPLERSELRKTSKMTVTAIQIQKKRSANSRIESSTSPKVTVEASGMFRPFVPAEGSLGDARTILALLRDLLRGGVPERSNGAVLK